MNEDLVGEQSGIFNETQKPRFKPWMRVIALIVIFAFLYQDIVWAFDYNPGLLFNPQFSLNTSEYALSNPSLFNKAVAKSVYRFLKPLVNKEIDQVQIKPDLIIDTHDAGRVTRDELKNLYEWLEKPETGTVPCSAYVLYNLLQERGIKARIEELSSLLQKYMDEGRSVPLPDTAYAYLE